MEFKCESTNKASERLVAVNFKGLLPAFIACELMKQIKDAKESSIGEIEFRDEIYS